MAGGRLKFQPGDRFRGRSEGVKAWIRDKAGTVIGYHRPTHEYRVRLDDGEEAFVSANSLDRIENAQVGGRSH